MEHNLYITGVEIFFYVDLFFTALNLGAQGTGLVADQRAAPFLVVETVSQ